MDRTPVVIGYKSRYNAANEKREVRDGRPRIPRETVKVFTSDQEVGTISLGVLLRFSRYAKETFPKPPIVHGGEHPTATNAATSSKVDKQPGTPARKDWADESDDVDSDWESRITTPGSTLEKTESSPSEKSKQKLFYVYIDGVYMQPSFESVEYLLKWMEANKGTRNNEPLHPLTPAPLHTVKLNILIDMYAAALGYNLTPFPHDLRHEILTRLTATPVDLEGFEYIAYRLPLGDPIMTRLFTSHFEHIDAQSYAEGVADDIFSFVTEFDGENKDEPFFKRYNKISRSREFKQRQAKRDQKKEERVDSLRGDFESFAGANALLAAEQVKAPAEANKNKYTGQIAETSASPGSTSSSEKSATGSTEQTSDEVKDETVPVKSQGRHRNRRNQQKKGKAKAAAK